MVEAFYKGILVALTLFISMGPIFFAVIETSITNGFKYAMCISIGVLLSDIMYISLIYFGLSSILESEAFRLWLGLGGGVVLEIYGITCLLKKTDMHAADLHINKSSYHVYLIKGFVINTLNPMVVLFWIATVGIAATLSTEARGDKTIFFAVILGTVFLVDLVKAFLAGKIKHIITPKRLHYVNVITGIIMMVLGVYLVYSTLTHKHII